MPEDKNPDPEPWEDPVLKIIDQKKKEKEENNRIERERVFRQSLVERETPKTSFWHNPSEKDVIICPSLCLFR